MTRIATLRGPRVNWLKERRSVEKLFDSFDLDLDLTATIASVSKEKQCLIAVVRAISLLDGGVLSQGENQDEKAGILFLDEPSVYLSAAARERLFTVVRRFVQQGGSAVLVSHDLDEVMDHCDTVTILRDGENVAEVTVSSTSRSDLVRLILGDQTAGGTGVAKRVDCITPEGEEEPDTAVVISNVTAKDGSVVDFSLNIAVGEVVGLTGLIGSGFESVPYLLQGDRRCVTGSISLGIRSLDLTELSIGQAISEGICLVPAERARLGLALPMTLAENLVSVPLVMKRFFRGGFLRQRSISQNAQSMLADSGVKPPNPDAKGWQLSGGNQQKVVVAKWMNCGPRFLVLHEPTQGVDIGARSTISEALLAIAATGTPIVCASNDHEQLEQICDRVLIFSEGRPVLELRGEQVTKKAITDRCLSISRPIRPQSDPSQSPSRSLEATA